jgi:hypothetical protein
MNANNNRRLIITVVIDDIKRKKRQQIEASRRNHEVSIFHSESVEFTFLISSDFVYVFNMQNNLEGVRDIVKLL